MARLIGKHMNSGWWLINWQVNSTTDQKGSLMTQHALHKHLVVEQRFTLVAYN